MTDFQKMIRDTPSDMVREELIRSQKEKLELEPDLVEFGAASYLAQEIAFKMHELYEPCREQFKKDTEIDPGHLNTCQVIGALQLLASAIARQLIEDSPHPLETTAHVIAQSVAYGTMVEDLRMLLKRVRKA